MLPNLFRLTLLLALTLALLIGAIRAQPYDDSELRAFLFPEGCEQPCVMGIQLNTMSRDDVIGYLEQHPYVDSIQELDDDTFQSIRWMWSEGAPPFIAPNSHGFAAFPEGRTEDLTIHFDISAVDFFDLYGDDAHRWYDISSVGSMNIYLSSRETGTLAYTSVWCDAFYVRPFSFPSVIAIWNLSMMGGAYAGDWEHPAIDWRCP